MERKNICWNNVTIRKSKQVYKNIKIKKIYKTQICFRKIQFELTDNLVNQVKHIKKKVDTNICNENHTASKENKRLETDIIPKEKNTYIKERNNRKNFSKTFKCDLCNKSYTWYSGLSNHKRFIHSILKET